MYWHSTRSAFANEFMRASASTMCSQLNAMSFQVRETPPASVAKQRTSVASLSLCSLMDSGTRIFWPHMFMCARRGASLFSEASAGACCANQTWPGERPFAMCSRASALSSLGIGQGRLDWHGPGGILHDALCHSSGAG